VQRVIKLISVITISAFLSGCTQTTSSQESLQSSSPYSWHDGSKGGHFGIGEDWSIEILHAEYKSYVETVVQGGQVELTVVPAEYEWIQDERIGPQSEPEMVPQSVTIPATYRTITETTVVAPAKFEYNLTKPIFNSDNTVKTPAMVLQRHVKAVIKREERRVIDTPERVETRLMPVEYREGYRRVLRKPSSLIEDIRPAKVASILRKVEARPAQFLVLNQRSGVSHTFDSYEKLTAFVESLKPL